MKKRFTDSTTRKQCSDTGLAMTLISILSGLIFDKQFFHIIALGLVIINMIVPMFFYPLAIIWFGLSKIMGAITSRILLTVIFFLIVTPVALVRRWTGKDNLNLRKFRKGDCSVFVERNHKYDRSDMIHLY